MLPRMIMCTRDVARRGLTSVAALLGRIEEMSDDQWFRVGRTWESGVPATPSGTTSLSEWMAHDDIDTIAWLRFGGARASAYSPRQRRAAAHCVLALRAMASAISAWDAGDSRNLHDNTAFLYAIFTS